MRCVLNGGHWGILGGYSRGYSRPTGSKNGDKGDIISTTFRTRARNRYNVFSNIIFYINIPNVPHIPQARNTNVFHGGHSSKKYPHNIPQEFFLSLKK